MVILHRKCPQCGKGIMKMFPQTKPLIRNPSRASCAVAAALAITRDKQSRFDPTTRNYQLGHFTQLGWHNLCFLPSRRVACSFHVLTCLLSPTRSAGIVRPICFAVLRLIIDSNFVGCSTGRSAGFAPLRILST